MHQAQVPLGSLPVHLICLSDGSVVFVKVAEFPAVFDLVEDDNEVHGDFFDDFFVFYKGDGSDQYQETTYHYNTRIFYKAEPLMLEWLKRQKLYNPFGG